MKVLAINGSPHKNGSTYTAIRLIADELEKQDITTEIVHVGADVIRGCTGCNHCSATGSGRCVFDDDAVNECLTKSEDVDGIIIGSPVYYSGISGTMKCFLDRFFYAGHTLQYKVGTAVVALRRSGAVDTFHQMNNYFNLRDIIITPSHYWNALHSAAPGQTALDDEGVQVMRTLGKNMAWLMKSLAYSSETVALPTQEPRVFTNFIR
ncbi:MAG: flavodoxin family protein [Acetanaerobacterium sp.]